MGKQEHMYRIKHIFKKKKLRAYLLNKGTCLLRKQHSLKGEKIRI